MKLLLLLLIFLLSGCVSKPITPIIYDVTFQPIYKGISVQELLDIQESLIDLQSKIEDQELRKELSIIQSELSRICRDQIKRNLKYSALEYELVYSSRLLKMKEATTEMERLRDEGIKKIRRDKWKRLYIFY